MEKYTVKEVASIIGVDRVTIMRRIKDGSLRAYKEGGKGNKLFISEEDFNAFLETDPRYSRKVQHHHSAQDAVVDFIAANEAFNVYASFLKKLMVLPKNDDTIKYVLPMVENHKSLLDLVINELKEK